MTSLRWLRLLLDPSHPAPPSMNFHGDHVQVIQKAMSDVVNGPGTAGRARLPIAASMACVIPPARGLSGAVLDRTATRRLQR